MISILFIDRDTQYTGILCSLLSGLLPSYSFFDISYPAFSVYLSNRSDCIDRLTDISFIHSSIANPLLVFYNPAQFFTKIPFGNSVLLSENIGLQSDKVGQFHLLRYSAISDFVAIIDKAIPADSLADELPVSMNMCCIAGQVCPESRYRYIQGLTEVKVTEGLIPVIIELCPRYECLFSLQNSVIGNSLSEAMLRISAEDLELNAIGTYLFPSINNILCFRPFECSDDIFECTPDTIRKFVDLLVKWNSFTLSSHFIILSCSSIPFSFIYRASVLCDQLIILNMEDTRSPPEEFNNELSALLCNIPDSCVISTVKLKCELIKDRTK